MFEVSSNGILMDTCQVITSQYFPIWLSLFECWKKPKQSGTSCICLTQSDRAELANRVNTLEPTVRQPQVSHKCEQIFVFFSIHVFLSVAAGSYVWTFCLHLCSSVNFRWCIYLSRDEPSAPLFTSALFVLPIVFTTQINSAWISWAGCGFVAHIADISPYDTCPAVHLSEIQQWASGAGLASESQSPFDEAGSVMDLNFCGVLWVPGLLNSWPLA